MDDKALQSLLESPRIEVKQPQSVYSYSDTQFEIIRRYIQEFEKTLDADQEVGVLLTNFGQAMLMEVTDVWYEKSVLMVFHGYVNGEKATLIQHISQLNFLLTTLPRNPALPHRPIGFAANWD